MKLLIDANVILDMVFNRRDCDISIALFRKVKETGTFVNSSESYREWNQSEAATMRSLKLYPKEEVNCAHGREHVYRVLFLLLAGRRTERGRSLMPF